MANIYSNNRMTIHSDGSIGIGTTSPSAKLYVGGKKQNHHFSYKIWSYLNTNYNKIYVNGNIGLGTINPSNSFHISTSGSIKFKKQNHHFSYKIWRYFKPTFKYIYSSGVSIGSHNPTTKLHVVGLSTKSTVSK